MKNILVPTDFSANADNALNYAIDLAKKENAKLILLHAFHVNYQVSYGEPQRLDSEIETLQKISEEKLKGLTVKIEHAGGVTYETVSTPDLATDAILRIISDRNIDLIVMGTKGATGVKEFTFGSNTAKVIEKTSCPVIAVPEQASFREIKQITYATDYQEGDITAIRKLLEIATPYHAQLNILHVYKETEDRERDAMKNFMEEVNKQIDYNNLTFQIVEGDDINAKLEEYMKMNYTDLLVLSTHHHKLMERLFGKNITKKMIHHTIVPLMIIHYEKTEPVLA
jgi:nucleotide-binding universal stress UspA family protein